MENTIKYMAREMVPEMDRLFTLKLEGNGAAGNVLREFMDDNTAGILRVLQAVAAEPI